MYVLYMIQLLGTAGPMDGGLYNQIARTTSTVPFINHSQQRIGLGHVVAL